MALTRVSARKIAANRANAQKSTGPRTPAGKARTSRNSCLHFCSARRHTMPESWEHALHQEALRVTEHTTDPVRRELERDLAFHVLWLHRLHDKESRLIENCLRRYPEDPKRGANLFFFDPSLCAFRRYTLRLERKLARAGRALHAHLQPQPPAVAAPPVQPKKPHPGASTPSKP